MTLNVQGNITQASDLSNGTTGSGAIVLASAPTIASPVLSGSASGNGTIPNAMLVTAPIVRVVQQVFTATGTYTPTAGMLYCIAECVGGGGGGGGAAATSTGNASGGGGGAGSYSRARLTAAQIGVSQAVTIPVASAGGATGNNPGIAGGDVSLGALLIGKGGGFGSGAPTQNPGAAGAGGVAGTGDLTATGAPGGVGFGSAATGITAPAGIGGSTLFGGAPLPATSQASVVDGPAAGATSYGAGGSGGSVQGSASTAAGGAGGKGLVVITEFCSQ
jgi:hypothetical protein